MIGYVTVSFGIIMIFGNLLSVCGVFMKLLVFDACSMDSKDSEPVRNLTLCGTKFCLN